MQRTVALAVISCDHEHGDVNKRAQTDRCENLHARSMGSVGTDLGCRKALKMKTLTERSWPLPCYWRDQSVWVRRSDEWMKMLSNPGVAKLVRVVTQIKVAIMSYYYPQYFAVIAHNTEQHCAFASALLPPPKNRILPQGVIYPQFGTTALIRGIAVAQRCSKLPLIVQLLRRPYLERFSLTRGLKHAARDAFGNFGIMNI